MFIGAVQAGPSQGPAGNQPILSVIQFDTLRFKGSSYTMLVIATPSNIYTECPPDARCLFPLF